MSKAQTDQSPEEQHESSTPREKQVVFCGPSKHVSLTKEYVKTHAGLTLVPVKVMVMAELEVLDLSHNAIETIPKGLFSDIPSLKSCDLSHNSIKALPDDIGALKGLESLLFQHNCLSSLPIGLFSLTTVKVMDVSYNRIAHLPHAIGGMVGLQVLILAGNRLRNLPCDVGWLSLKQLNVFENPDLHIPAHVLRRGFRAVMNYLQVVGEQHQLVETHMAALASNLPELHTKHPLLLPGGVEDENAVLLRIRLAQKRGVLSCSHCNLAAVPSALTTATGWQADALQGVQVVDLSHNRLPHPAADLLLSIDSLLVLNLSYNGLSTWPSGLRIPSLAVLDLSFNKLQALPEDIGHQLPRLQQLYLANNFISSLPGTLAQMQLQDLFLSENDLQTVPKVLGACSSLAKLSLAACRLSSPCEELDALSGLRFLDVSFNELSTLSASLSTLAGLSALNLAYNPLNTFPEVLSCLTALRELNLDYTGITTFPSGLGELRLLEGLQAEGCQLVAPYSILYGKDPLLLVALNDRCLLNLDLTDCGLDTVPQVLLQQTQLTSLNLSKNAIQDIPTGLGNLTRLQQLTMKGNPLKQPYARVMDARGELALLPLVRPEGLNGRLGLEACGFEVLPNLVWELPGRNTALLELHLTNNRMKDLPQELSSLVALTRLILDSNQFRQVPAVVLGMPSLAVLQASNNSITFLPDEIGNMQTLQALMLAGNQIRQLPESISRLPRLRALVLASNRIWQLPGSLTESSTLRLLDCSHNLLARLPMAMSTLISLKTLKLAYNRLEWVPAAELALLHDLVELQLVGNVFMADGVELDALGGPAVQQLLTAIAASPSGMSTSGSPSVSQRVPTATAGSGAAAGATTADAAAWSASRCSSRSALSSQGSGEAPAAAAPSSLKGSGHSRSQSPGTVRGDRRGAGVSWSHALSDDDAPSSSDASSAAKQQSDHAGAPAGNSSSHKDANCDAATRTSADAAEVLVRSDSKGILRSSSSFLEPNGGRPSFRSARKPSVRFVDEAGPEQAPPDIATATAAAPLHPQAAAEVCAQPPPMLDSSCSVDAAAAKAVISEHLMQQQPDPEACQAGHAAKQAHCRQRFQQQEQEQQQQENKGQHGHEQHNQEQMQQDTHHEQQVPAEAAHMAAAVQVKTAVAEPASGAVLAAIQHAALDASSSQQCDKPPAVQPKVAQAVLDSVAAELSVAAGSEAATTIQQQPTPGQLQHPAVSAADHCPMQTPGAVQKESGGHHTLQGSECSSSGSGDEQHRGRRRITLLESGWLPWHHQESDARAPLVWDRLPLMDIPRIVKACVQPPPPPPVQQSVAAHPARPQTQLRFKRVMQQSAVALALLDRGMQLAGGSAAAAGGSTETDKNVSG